MLLKTCEGWALNTLLLNPVQEFSREEGGVRLIRGGRLIRTLVYTTRSYTSKATTLESQL